MKNKNKTIIGIFLDGLTLRVAQCEQQFESIYVKKLEEFILKEPLTEEKSAELDINSIPGIDGEAPALSFSEPKEAEPLFDDMDDFMGIGDDTDFLNLTNNKEIPTTEVKASNEDLNLQPTEEVLPQYNLSSSGYYEISRFLNQFPLASTLVSFITAEDKLFWNYIPYSAKKIKKGKVKKQSLSREQKKDQSVQFDMFYNKNKSAYSLVYEGQHDVINIFENVQEILNIKNINYCHTEPLESTLVNAVLTQYKFKSGDYVLVLYLSQENKIAIILQDDNYIKSFPLIIQANDTDIIREAIISKIMLEQDVSQLNITQNILICGDFSCQEDIAFFQDNFQSSYISAFSFTKEYTIQNELPLEFHPDINKLIIPKFVPSIMLAYRALNNKSKRLHMINMLPQLIIDKQKYFKLNWHGILIMILVFITTMWTTYDILSKKIELATVQTENHSYNVKINEKRAFEKILHEYTAQVDYFENNRKQITNIIGKKNQWAHIFNKFSNFASQHSYFWIDSIDGGEQKIYVKGISYNKKHVTDFSNLLPQGNIQRINISKIQDEPVWTFEISFDYPDPSLYNPLFQEIKVEVDPIVEDVKTETKEVKKDIRKPKEQPKTKTIKTIAKEDSISLKQKQGSELYVKARINVQEANYNEAIEMFAEFLSNYPEHRLVPMAIFLTAESYLLSEHYEQAIPYYNIVLDLKKVKQLESLFQLGLCYENLDEYDKAINSFNELLRRYPKSLLSKNAEKKIMALEETIKKQELNEQQNTKMQADDKQQIIDNIEESNKETELVDGEQNEE
ncbi:MAG: tetratricopeptide repeat protein [Candidatus Cloacimonadales bacterium]|jgi:TolA-binding protein/uncharacterized protein YlbG (UPF0298 family)|nr:tetratricopeptide repeat protein [Candidatus Cloacimonadota bacterium]MDD2650773.1 tetratricopeptide repeat protein [Candidatus Cloacimonadota bacterium]MDD3500927.1 tetratricopeptide repeat protein [Candidatus Cloacimonadota bacterium]MDX9976727.1 tetratricopeptide repeat protein [Candidatus Cloacimonadales bacterium]